MPAYLIAEVGAADAAALGPAARNAGARALAAGGRSVALEGAPPAGGLVVLAFDSMARLGAFARARPRPSADARILGVEGTASPGPAARGRAGYVIGQITVADARAYEAYKAGAGRAIAAFAGRFLARGGKLEALAGTPRGERVVLIEFASFARALDWYRSALYAAPLAIRRHAARSTIHLVEGC